MKVITNRCYGRFSISEKALKRYYELKGIKLYTKVDKWERNEYSTQPFGADGKWGKGTYIGTHDFDRCDPILIQVIEEMGSEANGSCASLEITEIPDGTDYVIEEYDGYEHIAESHAIW